MPAWGTRRRRGETGEGDNARGRAGRTRPAGCAPDPRPADSRAAAGLGPDRGQGVRPQPLRAAHPARPGRGRDLPTRARHRGRRRRRRRPGRGGRAGQAGRRDDGRHGPHVRRRLRAVHVRARRGGHPVLLEPRLADPRRRARDAPDRLRIADRRPRHSAGTDPADPRRHVLGRHGRRDPRQAARADRALDDPPARAGGSARGGRRRPPDRRRRRDRRRRPRHRPARRRCRHRARRHADAPRHAARHPRPRRRVLHRDAEQRVDGARLLPDRLHPRPACASPATAARPPISPQRFCSRSSTTWPPAASRCPSTTSTPSTRSRPHMPTWRRAGPSASSSC